MAKVQCAYCQWFVMDDESTGRCTIALPRWVHASIDSRVTSDQDGCDLGVSVRAFPLRFYPEARNG